MRANLIIPGIFLLICNTAQAAAADIAFECGTKGMPTTSFKAMTTGRSVTLEVVHANGTARMPIFSGTITPDDFEYLREKAEILQKLGDRQTIVWPRENCREHQRGVITCIGSEPAQFNGVPVRSVHLMTRKVMTETFDYRLSSTEVVVSFLVGARFHDVEMHYDSQDCEF